MPRSAQGNVTECGPFLTVLIRLPALAASTRSDEVVRDDLAPWLLAVK